MDETRQNLMVGLFVLVGLSVLGALIVLFGRVPGRFIGPTGYPVYVLFDSAPGIQEGNPVTLGGIRIGRVAGVEFANPEQFDRGVRVLTIIDEEIKLPRLSRAVTTEPVLGQGRPPIEIIPGPSDLAPLEPNAEIPGEMRGAVESFIPEHILRTFDKVAARADEFLAAATPVLRDMHELLQARAPAEVDRVGGPQGNLASALARADDALKHINSVLGDPGSQSKIREAIDNFHQISVDGREVAASLKTAADEADTLVRDTRELVNQADESLERVDRELVGTLQGFQAVAESTNRVLTTIYDIASAIDRGEGTLGGLVRDSKLYEVLVITAERLAQTIEEARLLILEWQKGRIRVTF
jgi:ABC-type transporter Mla subunit MlaD